VGLILQLKFADILTFDLFLLLVEIKLDNLFIRKVPNTGRECNAIWVPRIMV